MQKLAQHQLLVLRSFKQNVDLHLKDYKLDWSFEYFNMLDCTD